MNVKLENLQKELCYTQSKLIADKQINKLPIETVVRLQTNEIRLKREIAEITKPNDFIC